MDFSKMTIAELNNIISTAKAEKERKENEVYKQKLDNDWAMVVKAIKNFCENHGDISFIDNTDKELITEYGLSLRFCSFDRVGVIDWE